RPFTGLTACRSWRRGTLDTTCTSTAGLGTPPRHGPPAPHRLTGSSASLASSVGGAGGHGSALLRDPGRLGGLGPVTGDHVGHDVDASLEELGRELEGLAVGGLGQPDEQVPGPPRHYDPPGHGLDPGGRVAHGAAPAAAMRRSALPRRWNSSSIWARSSCRSSSAAHRASASSWPTLIGETVASIRL